MRSVISRRILSSARVLMSLVAGRGSVVSASVITGAWVSFPAASFLKTWRAHMTVLLSGS